MIELIWNFKYCQKCVHNSWNSMQFLGDLNKRDAIFCWYRKPSAHKCSQNTEYSEKELKIKFIYNFHWILSFSERLPSFLTQNWFAFTTLYFNWKFISRKLWIDFNWVYESFYKSWKIYFSPKAIGKWIKSNK